MLRRATVVLGVLALLLASLATGASADDRAASGLVEVPGAFEVISSYEAPTYEVDNQKLVPVIVKLDEIPVASYDGSIEGYPATSPAVLGTDKLDPDSSAVASYRDYLAGRHALFEASLARVEPMARVTRSYEISFGGLAVLAPLGSIGAIAAMPGVVTVYEDRLEQLDTDRSPAYLGVGKLWRMLGGQSMAGEGIVVGAIDSGVWPEHPSYSDPDPAGNAYPAPNWSGSGTGDGCDFGDTDFNPDDAPFDCNNKLIGAYDFTDTYKEVVGLIETEFDSARDSNGHGTHTSTTAAGNGKVEATLFGVPYGRVSGIAPRAHVVMYKGCGLDGCFNSDTLASVEQAILDGVDVLNYSISGGGNPYGDVVSLGFLDAYNAGILVTPSAGNSGPDPDTVAHREPWTLTVGATTTDRSFFGSMTLTAANGDSLTVEGATLTDGIATPTTVVFAPDEDSLCIDLEPGTFAGEIVLCERGDIARVAKSYNVQQAGGAGMILLNPALQGTNLDNHFIPSLHLEVDEADLVRDFMAGHGNVEGTLTGSYPASVQGDTMAAFSSRGGPGQSLGISKPDVVAPGVNILAGHTPMPEDEVGGSPGQLYQVIGGTSMSAPHVAGAAALMLAANPSWEPEQVKSALMMTAYRGGMRDTDGVTPTTPFDMGSGRILPTAAAYAPITISESGANYVAYADMLWDANYPSLYVPHLDGVVTVERTVHNEVDSWTNWIARPVDVPDDLIVKVRKQKFALGPNSGPYADRTIEITVDARNVPDGEVRHAGVQFRSGSDRLYFPITIVKQDGGVIIDKTCDDATLAVGDYTECTVTVENTTLEAAEVTVTDRMPRNLRVRRGFIEGGERVSPKKVTTTVLLDPVEPPIVDVAVDNFASAFGYVGLGGFDSSLDVGATDESITNFGVPPFEFAGVEYDQIGVVSNGYVVVGGGDGADVDYINSDLPDEMQPNNVLAPFWTDLNPEAGGRVLVNVLSDGTDTWIVVEWEAVTNWGDGEANTAQIWIGTSDDANPDEDISFTYGSVSDGDGGFLTVGAENDSGTTGGTTYFDGTGVPPAPSYGGGSDECDANWPEEPCYEVDVFSVPGGAGGVHSMSFHVQATAVGPWDNWATMVGDTVIGTALAGFSGEVVP